MHPLLQKILHAEKKGTATLLIGREMNEEARELCHALICPKSRCEATHPDFLVVQPEKGAIRIDKIRDLIGRIQFKPIANPLFPVLIEEAERMTEEAANAFLKTLEEPPSHTLFFLTTPIPERLPATLRSRCQKIFLSTPQGEERERWKETLPLWREKFLPLFSGSTDFSTLSSLVEELSLEKEELESWLNFMKVWWRDLAVCTATPEASPLLLAAPQELIPLLQKRTLGRIFREIDCLIETERAIEANVSRPLALERLLMHLTTP